VQLSHIALRELALSSRGQELGFDEATALMLEMKHRMMRIVGNQSSLGAGGFASSSLCVATRALYSRSVCISAFANARRIHGANLRLLGSCLALLTGVSSSQGSKAMSSVLLTPAGIVGFAMVGIIGCSTTPPGSNPDDMSASEHEAAAEEHGRAAAEHATKYDPDARKIASAPGGTVWYGEGYEYYWPDDLDDGGWSQYVYNPVLNHQSTAAEHREHASQHRAAARELDDFEKAECFAFDEDVRATCPLLGLSYRVEDIESGVRIEIEDEIPLDAVYMHMRCHYAFGRANGREGMTDCALYIMSLAIERSGERTLDLTTTDALLVGELRKRARSHEEPEQAP